MNAPSITKDLALSTLPDPSAGASPVMAQFFEAKTRQPDALVFFRMGDFYELFFEDAQKASAALGSTAATRSPCAGCRCMPPKPISPS
jgi:DNA mismatch repair protein MutS